MQFNLMFGEAVLSLYKLRQLCGVGTRWRIKGALRPPSPPLFEWRQLEEACQGAPWEGKRPKKRKKKKKDELFLKTFQQEAAHNPGDLSEIDTLHDVSERAAAAWPLPLPGIYGG